ncbi:MAG TPA: M81 family metallopeptidase, partial [Acetobacteraceae bacterium]|nr:M81 family metallopeptidase [Acetobacteraceae bacterium]
MTLRIAVGGFLHETHSFAPRPTTWQDFMQPGGFPRLQHGSGMLDALRGTSMPIAGAISEGEKAGVTLAPLAWTTAAPAGPIRDEAFER